MRKNLTLCIFLFLVTVSGLLKAQTYCTPTWNNTGSNWQMGTQNVRIGSISNTSGCPTNVANYSNYTSLSTTHYPNDVVACSVQVGSSNSTWFCVYIDFNSDGDFTDVDERVISSGSINAGGWFYGSFTIPSTAPAGAKMMRVISDYGGMGTPPSSCGPNTYAGECEDYTIEIMAFSGFDLAMTRVDTPQVFNTGLNQLSITATNRAADTIFWFDLGYSLDGGTPELVYDFYPTKPLSGGKSVQYSFSKKVDVPSKGNHTLKVWVSNANDQIPDDKPENDTLLLNFCTGMAGTYTVGTGGNFPTLVAAYNELLKCGIAGPVTFNVTAGNYTDNLILKSVPGMSDKNTVSFVGASKSTVTVTSSAQAVLDFDGGDYFTFKNIKFNANGYCVAWFHNSADYNVIDNCILNGNLTTTGSNYNVVLITNSASTYSSGGNNGNYNKILNNEINGGYVGVSIYGSSSNNASNYNNVIRGNTFKSQYYYGIYLYYGAYGTTIELNKIGNFRYSSAYGIQSYYCQRTKINANIINPGRYGIYMYYESNYGGDSAFITNNMIYNFLEPTYQVGIDLNYYSYKTHIMHNTIVISSSLNDYNNTFALRTYYMPNGTRVMNNIFVALSDAYLLNLYYPQGLTLDYNNYIYTKKKSVNRFYYYYPDAFFWDFEQFKNYTAQYLTQHDQNSMENVDPKFKSTTDYHLNPTYKPITLKNDVGLWFDVDGDPRCIYETALGADEPNFPYLKPTSYFVSEDTICFGTPVTFVNVADKNSKQGYWWYLNGKFKTSDFHFTHTFPDPDIDTVTLITENCGGRDTFTKIIVITAPLHKPKADFIAELNLVEAGFPINFYDLSTNCPSTWEWKVYPDSVYDPILQGWMPSHSFISPTHAGSQNPYISIDFPGTYEVCLIASNVNGYDTLCKDEYIVVKPVQWMCQFAFPSTRKALYGFLYDDGGPVSDYTNNMNCDIILEPCASELTFELKKFNVAAGDFLRIYEGRNATGRPLWNTTKFPGGLTGLLSDMDTFYVSKTGVMYVQWVTSSTTVAAGWEAEWYGVYGSYLPPTAKFDGPDSVCEGMPVTFQDLSTGTSLNYSWDFDEDGFGDDFTSTPTWSFPFAGKYKVTLLVDDCGGSSKYDKYIIVTQANAAPTADFEADVLKPVAGEDFVQFTDLSHANSTNPLGCVNMWEWTVYPDTMLDPLGLPVKSHTFIGGTDKNSRNPIIRFEDTGYYHIKLNAGYSYVFNTITKTNYIYAIKYCNSAVANLNPDIGISRVKLGDINHVSTIGKSAYSNFTNDAQTYLDYQGTYTLTVERSTTYNNMNRKAWIDWNMDGDFLDAGELLGSESSARTAAWSVTFQVPTTASQGATRLRVSTNLENYTNEPCGNKLYGETEDYRVIIRPDGTPPEITLTGKDTVYMDQCDCNYTDAGASAYDNIDGTRTASFDTTNWDCKLDGTYFYRYEAVDTKGNKTTKDRTIIVSKEQVPPTITLVGNLIDTLDVLIPYIDPGYNASDACSGLDKVVVSGTVDQSKPGVNLIKYTAYDKNGNTADVIRQVVVVDREDPFISLNGYSVMDIEVHTAFTDPGVTVSDNYCTELEVDVDGSVDIDILGSYTITYSVTDCNGNGPVSVQRVVNVVDKTAPVISINPPYKSGDTITLEVLHVFELPTMKVSDNHNRLAEMTISESGTYISEFGAGNAANKLGYFNYIYKVEDVSGNSSQVEYVIFVVDTEKPVITLSGSPVINLCRFQKLDPAQYAASVTDNFYTGITIDIAGTYFSEYEGTMYYGLFNITYNAKDGSDNDADQVVRYINVEYCPWYGVDETGLEEYVKVFPNPTRGEFVAEINLPKADHLTITITNVLGQTISKTEYLNSIGGTFNFNLSNEADGVYFVNVKTSDASTVLKLTLNK